MLKRVLTALLAFQFMFVSSLQAQAWNHSNWTDGSVPAPTWTTTPTIGGGGTAWGGNPPALSFEATEVGAIGYTPSEWLTGADNDGVCPSEDYETNMECGDVVAAKFRITCNASHVGTFDPILFPGQVGVGHHHTFIGNKHTDENSDYTSLRNNPASTCSGGPLNATAYWEPSVLKQLDNGVIAAIKPDIVSFYYTHERDDADEHFRLLRNIAFIGGTDPNDVDAEERTLEITSGLGVLAINRIDGWGGWGCMVNGNWVPVTHDDAEELGIVPFSRGFRTPSGEDPWEGACTSSGGNPAILIAHIGAPQCWDGHNLRSPNGRDHFRYMLRKNDGTGYVCPTGWWKVPNFEVKVEFSTSGWDDYGQWYLSSDRMSADPEEWHTPGITMHFDWMGAWQQDIMDTWNIACNGMDSVGNDGGVNGAECLDSTISSTQKMKTVQTSPDPDFSNDPILTFNSYWNDPNSDRFFPLAPGEVIEDYHSDHASLNPFEARREWLLAQGN